MSESTSYKIISELGHGTFSTVFLAENVDTGEEFAVKAIPKSKIRTLEDQQRFQREIDTMAYIQHENLVRLHDFFSDDEFYYLVMDYCQGGELQEYLASYELEEEEAAKVFRQIAQAIDFIHSYNVAHLDLKPANILITEFPRIKVADFGFVTYVKKNEHLNTFYGSTCYCSPECLSHREYDGLKSDIWSLGVILYTLVVGKPPWNMNSESVMIRQIKKASFTVPNHISLDCQNLIEKMLRLNPEERISIIEVLEHPWLNEVLLPKILIPEIESLPHEKMDFLIQRSESQNVISPFPEKCKKCTSIIFPEIIRSTSFENFRSFTEPQSPNHYATYQHFRKTSSHARFSPLKPKSFSPPSQK